MMDWKSIERAATEQGWRKEPTKKGFRMLPPDPSKPAVQVHQTPSDRRALANTLAEMKRSGLVWPWPPKRGET